MMNTTTTDVFALKAKIHRLVHEVGEDCYMSSWDKDIASKYLLKVLEYVDELRL